MKRITLIALVLFAVAALPALAREKARNIHDILLEAASDEFVCPADDTAVPSVVAAVPSGSPKLTVHAMDDEGCRKCNELWDLAIWGGGEVYAMKSVLCSIKYNCPNSPS